MVRESKVAPAPGCCVQACWQRPGRTVCAKGRQRAPLCRPGQMLALPEVSLRQQPTEVWSESHCGSTVLSPPSLHPTAQPEQMLLTQEPGRKRHKDQEGERAHGTKQTLQTWLYLSLDAFAPRKQCASPHCCRRTWPPAAAPSSPAPPLPCWWLQ